MILKNQSTPQIGRIETRVKGKTSLYILYWIVDEFDFEKIASQVETMENQLGRNGETLSTCWMVEKILNSSIDDF